MAYGISFATGEAGPHQIAAPVARKNPSRGARETNAGVCIGISDKLPRSACDWAAMASPSRVSILCDLFHELVGGPRGDMPNIPGDACGLLRFVCFDLSC